MIRNPVGTTGHGDLQKVGLNLNSTKGSETLLLADNDPQSTVDVA